MQKTNAMPTKAETMTSVHESKQFPFVIVEQTTINENNEETKFRIGLAGQIVSEEIFTTLEDAENYISNKSWELIINLIGTTIQIMKENEEFKS